MSDHERFDSILRQLGTGGWNAIFYTGFALWGLIWPWTALSGEFMVPSHDHHCIEYTPQHTADLKDPPTIHLQDLGTQVLLNSNMVNTSQLDPCKWDVPIEIADMLGLLVAGVDVLEDKSTHNVYVPSKCSNWIFFNRSYTNTITSEFRLVCSQSALRSTYKNALAVGTVIGAVLTSVLADRIGRRTVIFVGSILYWVFTFTPVWLHDFQLILVFRLLLGICEAPLILTAYHLALEVCSPNNRSVWGLVLGIPSAVGTMIFGGVAYLHSNWRYLQFTTAILPILFIPFFWLYDESPRWLITSGRRKAAQHVIHRAERFNKSKQIKESDLEIIMNHIEKQVGFISKPSFKMKMKRSFRSIFAIFMSPMLCRVSLIIFLECIACSCLVYGISTATPVLSSCPYLTLVLVGLSELPLLLIMPPVIARIGRRPVYVVIVILTGAVILGLPFVPQEIHWVMITLTVLGRSCVAGSWQLLQLLNAELFPTVVRLQASATAHALGRSVVLGLPFITHYLNNMNPWISPAIFSILALVAGIATLGLPETKGKPLPDTVQHLENINTKNDTVVRNGNTVPDLDRLNSTRV